jgi:hypothetical protein
VGIGREASAATFRRRINQAGSAYHTWIALIRKQKIPKSDEMI